MPLTVQSFVDRNHFEIENILHLVNISKYVWNFKETSTGKGLQRCVKWKKFKHLNLEKQKFTQSV